MARESKFSIVLKPVQAWILSLAKFVTAAKGNLRVFEPVFIRRDKILTLLELLQNLRLIAFS